MNKRTEYDLPTKETIDGRPLIGITCRHVTSKETPGLNDLRLRTPYYHAVIQAGGFPILLPVAAERAILDGYFNLIHGIVLSGGDDIPPQMFGEERHPKTKDEDGLRLAIELEWTRGALERRIPILGICLGIQMLNVVAGGTLVQDIPSQITNPLAHQNTDDEQMKLFHDVTITPDSRLAQITGRDRLSVNTGHHQSVARVGEGFRVCATTEDGVVEAIESADDHWALGVQWHPERMLDDPIQQNLFKAFVEAVAMSDAVHR